MQSLSVNLLASKKREISTNAGAAAFWSRSGLSSLMASGPNYSANVYNAATDREWDKLSKATQDALDCAWDGTKYFQEKYAHSTSCDYTGISVCGMLKYCVSKADECKSEAVALFTCRDSNNDGGCRCSW